MIDKLLVYYIPHGGGPWNLLPDALGDPVGYGKLREYLINIGKTYHDKIKAILVISAHWEESMPTIILKENPDLLYDYYGFPEYTYHIKWRAPLAKDVSEQIENNLIQSGFTPQRDYNRGFDHGVFVPLMISFPDGDIPVAQLSLLKGLDPSSHIKMGKSLEKFRENGVLIIGSGMSYHNINSFFSNDPRVKTISEQFDNWLKNTIESSDVEQRNNELIAWKKAPGALFSHPRSEHLVPLFVCAGAGGNDPGHQDFSSYLMGAKVSTFVFG